MPRSIIDARRAQWIGARGVLVPEVLRARSGEPVRAADLISKVTDAVNEELAAWRNWPLDGSARCRRDLAAGSARLGPARARRR